MGLSANAAVMLVTLPPVPCEQLLPDGQLGYEDEPSPGWWKRKM